MADEQYRPYLPWIRRALTILAIVAVVLAFRDALAEAGSVAWPRPPQLLLSGLLAVMGIFSAAGVWSSLFPGLGYRDLVPGFSTAQLAKYVPGSIWQGVGQVLDVARLGSGYARASTMFLLQMWLQVSAGAVVALLALGALEGFHVAVVLAAVILTTATIWRPVLIGMATTLSRSSRRQRDPQASPREVIPDQRSLLGSWTLALHTMLIVATSFAVLLGEPRPGHFLLAVGAFAAAWVLGFLVVPLPAGVGVRELVLVTLLADQHGASSVLAAAIVHRIMTLVAEVAVAGSTAGLRGQR